MGEVFLNPNGGGYQIKTLDEAGKPLSFTIDEKTYQTLVTKGHIKPNGRPSPGPIANTVGLVIPKTLPNLLGNGAMPPDKAETKEESYWDKFKRGAKEGAQYYKDNVSQTMHEVAGSAMDKGGTVAMAGGATAAVGGAISTTGVGAVVGAPMVVVGGVGAAAGGIVSTGGAVTEGAATVLDSAADAIIKGEAPDVIKPAIALGTTLLDKLVGRKIPGRGGGGKPQSKPQSGTPAPSGGYVNGLGRCALRRYKQGCPDGRTPHHVVGDHSFKQPGDAGGYYPAGPKYPNGFKHADGWTVCASGKTKSSAPDGTRIKKSAFARLKDWYNGLDEHGKIHAIVDSAEVALGAKGTPKGTTSLGELEAVGAAAAAQVLGCDKAKMIKDLREAHAADGLPADMKVRADPFGSVRNLDASQMGTGRDGGGNR